MKPKSSNQVANTVALTLIWIFLMFFLCHYNVASIELDTGLIFDILPYATEHMQTTPFAIFPINFGTLFGGSFIYVVALLYVWVEHDLNRVDAPGIEAGSAKWGKANREFKKTYVSKEKGKNMIFSNEVQLNMDTRATRKNNNVIVIGGSGTGKSRFLVKPNLLQANCSYVITDPSGELLQTQAYHLEQKQGYKIKVFDLTDMSKSSHYNPFNYIRDENGVLMMVNCLIQNTNGDKKGGDPFWENSEKALVLACCFYLTEVVKKRDQNFASVMELLKLAEIDEDDPDAESVLDVMMNTLEQENPSSMAVKNYKIFKMAAGKTAKSILVSAGVRLQVFNFPAVAELTNDDSLDLASIGDEKTALFVVIPAADATFNFLVSMMYSQLFEALYYHAEHNCEGKRLKHHVRFLLDEFANIGTIPDFEKKLSTMRKYEISCTIILQSISQIKSMYEKQWEVLVDNCDSMLFLGCQGASTLEYINKKLGKTTIKSKDHSRTLGAKGSVSHSQKHEGRDLMTVSELQSMKDRNCILFIRGLDPFWCTKFKLEKHPNYKWSGDANKKYNYVYDPSKVKVDDIYLVKEDTEDKAQEEPMTGAVAQTIQDVKDNTQVIKKAMECEDVNADRIAKEKQMAQNFVKMENGECIPKETTNKHGITTNHFLTKEEFLKQVQNSSEGMIFDDLSKPFSPDFEFRTNKPYINSLDLFHMSFQPEEVAGIEAKEPPVEDVEKKSGISEEEPDFDNYMPEEPEMDGYMEEEPDFTEEDGDFFPVEEDPDEPGPDDF